MDTFRTSILPVASARQAFGRSQNRPQVGCGDGQWLSQGSIRLRRRGCGRRLLRRGRRHLLNAHLKEFDKIMKRGVGWPACTTGWRSRRRPGDHFLKWIGGYFETNWSVNPHWTAEFKVLPNHPVSSGVRPFAINDEWYYICVSGEHEGVTPILPPCPGETRSNVETERTATIRMFARLCSSARKPARCVGLPTGQGLWRGTRIWFHRRTQPRQLGIRQSSAPRFKRHCLDCQSGRPRWRRPPRRSNRR